MSLLQPAQPAQPETVVGLLRERPAKTDAQSWTKPCTKPRCKLTNRGAPP